MPSSRRPVVAAARTAGRMLRRTSKDPFNKRAGDEIPSLREFMHRQSVKSQYRDYLRTLRVIRETTDYGTLYRQVVREFRQQQSLEDRLSIQMAVTNGARQLKQLQSMVGYTGSSSSGGGGTTNGGGKESVEIATHQSPDDALAGDSWMETHDPDDLRGRVGVEWPWSRSDDDGTEKL